MKISKWSTATQKFNKTTPFLVATSSAGSNWSYPEHYHVDFFEIVYLHQGEMLHTVNGEKVIHKAKMLMLIRDQDTHALAGDNFTFTNLMIPNRWIRQLEKLWNSTQLSKNIFSQSHVIQATLNYEQHKMLEHELMNLNTPPTESGRAAKFSGFLINLFLTYFLSPAFFGYENEQLPDWLNNTVSWIHQRREKPIRVADIVEHSNKCPEHVSRAFKTYLGMSPSQYLNRQRLEYAADLLESSNYPLLEICYSVGFDNPSYFHRLFKKHYGLTPAAYRKANYKITAIS